MELQASQAVADAGTADVALSTGAESRTSSWATVLIVIAVATVARLIVAGSIGLEENGAYAAAMGRHFSWGYFDHPPLHYWLVGLMEWLDPARTAIVLRLPFIALSAGTTWLLYRLTANAFGERAGVYAAVVYSLCAGFSLFIGISIGPDGPLDFFLVLTAYLVDRALADRQRSTALWLGAGLAGGAALLSKYSAVFLFLGVLVFLASDPKRRRILATPGPWLAAAVALAAFAPVILWNHQHEWVSFSFQASRALPQNSGGAGPLALNLLAQFALLAPFMPGLVIEFGGALRKRHEAGTFYFACLAIFPVVIFAGLNLVSAGMPHWPMPGWLFAFPLLGAAAVRMSARDRARVNAFLVATTLTLALLVAAAIAYFDYGDFAGLVRLAFPDRPFIGNELSWQFAGWPDLDTALRQRGVAPGDAAFVGALTWRAAGRAAQSFHGSQPVICVCATPNNFRFIADPASLAGTTGIVVDTPHNFAAGEKLLDSAFQHRERLPSIEFAAPGGIHIELEVEKVRGFRPDAVTSLWRRPGAE